METNTMYEKYSKCKENKQIKIGIFNIFSIFWWFSLNLLQYLIIFMFISHLGANISPLGIFFELGVLYLKIMANGSVVDDGIAEEVRRPPESHYPNAGISNQQKHRNTKYIYSKLRNICSKLRNNHGNNKIWQQNEKK